MAIFAISLYFLSVRWVIRYWQGAIMPAHFQKSNLNFLYPENWTLDEDDASGDQSVTVYSPGGGFWSVAVHHGAMEPLILANAALDAMKMEYNDIEIQEVEETIADRKLTGFDLNFFLFDFTNTAQIRSVRCNNDIYVILCQAEDSEFEQIQRVFQAITVSMLNGIKDLNYWN
jgi:hypothetical protein